MAEQQNQSGTDAAGGAGENQSQGGNTNAVTYETWVGQQPSEIQTLLADNVKGLRTALEAERGTRKDLERQLRELAGKAGKDTELQRQLNDLASLQEAANLRAEFYEQGHGEGVKNLKLAFVVAQQEELIDKRGRVNWAEMRTRYPELFAQKQQQPPGNAGAGAGGGTPQQSPNQKMNDFIRRSAGRS